MQRNSSTKFFLSALFNTIIWLGFIPMSIWTGLETWDFLKTAQSTTGQIVDFEQVRSGSKRKNYPIVRFEVANQTYQFRSNSRSSGDSIGDTVNVLYQQSDPSKAKVGTTTTIWFMPGAFMLITLIFFPVVIYLWKRYRRSKAFA